MNNYISLDQAEPDVQRKFIAGVYFKMVFALAITAAVAYIISIFYGTSYVSQYFWTTPVWSHVHRFLKSYLYNILLVSAVIEFIVVFILSYNIKKLKLTSAMILFIFYSVLNGITLSSIFIYFKLGSIFKVFAITSLMFLGMSIYGSRTTSDLRAPGRYLVMGLIGLIIASLLNLFFRSSSLDWIICLIGVGIFVGLTAYDTQRILTVSQYANGTDDYKKIEVLGALELYLDFINLFLKLLRLFGKRK